MNETIEGVLLYLFGFGSAGAIAVWVFRNRTVLIAIAAWFHRTFSWLSKRFEYGNIAYNIEATVNRVGDILDRDAPDVLPYPIKITWANSPEALEASLRNGEIVVTMQYSANRERNLVVSTMAYLAKALLPRARAYLDRSLVKATDFTVAKQILQASSLDLAIPYFFEQYLDPATREAPGLTDDLTRLDRIQAAGLFTRVLLREIRHFGDKVYPATPSPVNWAETRDFVEFLGEIADRERGVDLPGGLMFPGQRIRTSFMLVARARTRLLGTRPYVRRIIVDLDRGVERMYVFARGEENIALAEDILEEAQAAHMLSLLSRARYTHVVDSRELPVICLVCALNLLTRPIPEATPSDTLLAILREHIPELQQGKVEAVATARQAGVRSKIAIRAISPSMDPVACCSSEGRQEAIETALGETIEFLPWSNDPRQLLVASLYPLEASEISEIQIDQDKRSAQFKVEGWKLRRKAMGKGDMNLRLASELTGWRITVLDINDNPPA